jgi:hypothetical protein
MGEKAAWKPDRLEKWREKRRRAAADRALRLRDRGGQKWGGGPMQGG